MPFKLNVSGGKAKFLKLFVLPEVPWNGKKKLFRSALMRNDIFIINHNVIYDYIKKSRRKSLYKIFGAGFKNFKFYAGKFL